LYISDYFFIFQFFFALGGIGEQKKTKKENHLNKNKTPLTKFQANKNMEISEENLQNKKNLERFSKAHPEGSGLEDQKHKKSP
jgi:hypothetical protein